MAENQAEAVAIEQRREAVAAAYVTGKSQRQIAAALGVSQSTVSIDLAEIRKVWLADAKLNFGDRQARELAKIDRVEFEAWEAWERTKGIEVPPIHPAAEPGGDPGGEPEVLRDGPKPRLRIAGFTGEEKYLALVLKCVERRSKMLGLDAPDILKLTGDVKQTFAIDPRNASDEELDILERIAKRRESGGAFGGIPDDGRNTSGENAAEF